LHINMHMGMVDYSCIVAHDGLVPVAYEHWQWQLSSMHWWWQGDRAALIWAAVWTGEAWPASGGKACGKSDIACRGLREEPNFTSYSARAIWSIIQFVYSGLGMATCPTCGAAER
jgi:hypothetical protein